MDYISQIELKALIMEASTFQSDFDISLYDKIEILEKEKITEADAYLVIFIKNTGSKRAWGSLEYRLYGFGEKSFVEIAAIDPNTKVPRVVVIPFDALPVRPGKDTKMDLILYLDWRALYTEG